MVVIALWVVQWLSDASCANVPIRVRRRSSTICGTCLHILSNASYASEVSRACKLFSSTSGILRDGG